MADPLKRAQEIGKASAKPIALFRRDADQAVVVNTVNAPFFFVEGQGTTKKFFIIVGANTASSGSIAFDVKLIRGGVSTPLKSWTCGAWTAGVYNEIGTDEIAIQDGDIFVADVTNGAAVLLPALLIGVVIEYGG